MLIVVSLISGKNFPERNTHSLQAEAKFDGELLATDPVEHMENPQFEQELAWELDKKSLAQHRLQRASIKLMIYAVDKKTTAKEQIGYVVLDVRSAAQSPTAAVAKACHLLHSKYAQAQSRPELVLAVYTDEGHEQQDLQKVQSKTGQQQERHANEDDEVDNYDQDDFHSPPDTDDEEARRARPQHANKTATEHDKDADIGNKDPRAAPQTHQADPPPPQGVTEADMYQAAMELELWKEAAREAFEVDLKRKEQALIVAFAREFRRRDLEREATHKRKMAEYEQLCEKLQNVLSEVEEKEKKVAAGQRELLQRRDDLQRRHDSRLKELQDASARMQADCNHRVELERARCRQLEEQVATAKSAGHDWEKRWRETEAAMRRLREAEADRPEVRLLHTVTNLQMEKGDLERRLDQANRAKQQYKSQLGRCLKELAVARQREQEQQQLALQKQHTELEHMRLRYLAAEEQDLVKRERGELREAKEGLDSLAFGLPSSQQPTAEHAKGNEHAARLIEERDTLLRTGVYSHEDEIVRELERRIHSALEGAS